MARRRKGRAINGIVLLNKGLEISSNQALQKVRWIYQAQKAGHTGALDPLASGMLPLCLGEATKFSQFLLDADKTYETTAKLGIRTTTSDADGEVVSQAPVNVSIQQLEAALAGFRGHSKQIPSMYSALKYQGKPLYHYARQGIEVPREARDIHVYELTLLGFKGDEVELRVRCSKGTYIRSLVDDLGQVLGCGAHVSRLHRTHVADYPNDKMITAEALEQIRLEDADTDHPYGRLDALLLPMDTAVNALPKGEIGSQQLSRFCNGNPVSFANPGQVAGTQMRLYAQDDGRFLGVGEVDYQGLAAPKRLVVY